MFQGLRCVHYSSTELVCKKQRSYSALAERDKYVLGVHVPVSTAECCAGRCAHVCHVHQGSFI